MHEKYRILKITENGYEEIHDGVVIRLQDMLAEGVLRSYCNSVLTVAESLKAINMFEENPPETVSEQISDLIQIADYFAAKADLAMMYEPKKLPTM